MSSASLRCEKMMEFEEILVGGTEYAAAAKEGLKLEGLYRYSLIGLGCGTATYEFYKDLFAGRQTDFELDMDDMEKIVPLDTGKTEIFDHYDINLVKLCNTIGR